MRTSHLRERIHGCTGKRRYRDEAAAGAAAIVRSAYARSYPCRHCAGWHLTSKEEKRVPVPSL